MERDGARMATKPLAGRWNSVSEWRTRPLTHAVNFFIFLHRAGDDFFHIKLVCPAFFLNSYIAEY